MTTSYNRSIYTLENLVTEWYDSIQNNSALTKDINLNLHKLNDELNNQTFLNNLLKNVKKY